MKTIKLYLSTDYLEIIDNCFQTSWNWIDEKYHTVYKKLCQIEIDYDNLDNGKVEISLTEKEYNDLIESIELLVEATGQRDYEIMNHENWEDRYKVIEGIKTELTSNSNIDKYMKIYIDLLDVDCMAKFEYTIFSQVFEIYTRELYPYYHNNLYECNLDRLNEYLHELSDKYPDGVELCIVNSSFINNAGFVDANKIKEVFSWIQSEDYPNIKLTLDGNILIQKREKVKPSLMQRICSFLSN